MRLISNSTHTTTHRVSNLQKHQPINSTGQLQVNRLNIFNTQILSRFVSSSASQVHKDTTNNNGEEISCSKAARFAELLDVDAKIDNRKNIIGLTKEELREELKDMDLEPYRIKQIWHNLYWRGNKSFHDMTELKKSVRQELEDRFKIYFGRPVKEEYSELDQTRKYLVDYAGNQTECVYIPDTNRATMCLSSQVGCSLNCRFCATGTQKLERNLKPDEIVGQLMLARHRLGEFPMDTRNKKVSNVVMMGQGEPLYNWKNVSKALQIMMEPDGLCMSRRKITLSTSGVVPLIHAVGELGVNLAVSLHATTDAVRSEIVPLNRTYPLDSLLEACRTLPGISMHKRVTFEYIMLDGVNDTMEDAQRLVEICKTMPSVVNLIPFNSWPGAPFKCSPTQRILDFSAYLERNYVGAPIRWSKGDDIDAACGQLKSSEENKMYFVKQQMFSKQLEQQQQQQQGQRKQQNQ